MGARVIDATTLTNIVSKYNNTYSNLLLDAGISPQSRDTINQMLTDFSAMTTELNQMSGTITALGLTIAGLGILPTPKTSVVDVYLTSAGTLNLDLSVYFNAPVAMSSYAQTNKPGWLTFNTSTGVCTGTIETVTQLTVKNFQVTATNPSGTSTSIEVRLIIGI